MWVRKGKRIANDKRAFEDEGATVVLCNLGASDQQQLGSNGYHHNGWHYDLWLHSGHEDHLGKASGNAGFKSQGVFLEKFHDARHLIKFSKWEFRVICKLLIIMFSCGGR